MSKLEDLVAGHDRLDAKANARLANLLEAGDPRGEVRDAWHADLGHTFTADVAPGHENRGSDAGDARQRAPVVARTRRRFTVVDGTPTRLEKAVGPHAGRGDRRRTRRRQSGAGCAGKPGTSAPCPNPAARGPLSARWSRADSRPARWGASGPPVTGTGGRVGLGTLDCAAPAARFRRRRARRGATASRNP